MRAIRAHSRATPNVKPTGIYYIPRHMARSQISMCKQNKSLNVKPVKEYTPLINFNARSNQSLKIYGINHDITKLMRSYSTNKKDDKTLTAAQEKVIIEKIAQIEKANYDAYMKDSQRTEVDRISQDIGLADYISRVLATTGIGCTMFLASGAFFASTIAPSLGSILIGMVSSFASIYFFNRSKPSYKFVTIEKNNHKCTSKIAVYSESKYIAAGILCASIGLTVSPLIASVGAAIAVKSAIMSATIMTGAATAAVYSKPGSLIPYRTAIYSALFGLIGVGVMSIGASLLGYTNAYEILYSVDVYGGIALFSVLTAMDIQLAIKTYRDGNPDHMQDAANGMLNFTNIFVRVMQAIGERK